MSRRPTGSSVDGPQLLMSTVGWIRKAVSCGAATVQVLLPDEAGRLRVFASDGEHVTGGRLRSGRRRQVFRSRRPFSVPLSEPAGCLLRIYPLVADGESIGVVEIVAASDCLEERSDVLDAVIGQSAIVFRSVVGRRSGDAALLLTGGMLQMAGELLRAETPSSAVGSVVRWCFERAGAPVAGLLPDRSGTGWIVAATNGLGAGRRAGLQRRIAGVGGRAGSASTRDRLAASFAAIVGRDRAEALEARDAVVVVAGARPGDEEPLEAAMTLLREALDRIGAVDRVRRRDESLDLAIAWTAHELRGPLVGARAALGHVTVADEDGTSRELLRRSRDEIGLLVDLVDPLLRLSAGSASLRMRQADLVRIARDAVASCCLGSEGPSVDFRAPESAWVRADARHLRGAIANLVRNAVACSPPTAPVEVSIETRGDVARVCVRDRGPGVPAAERRVIFDPFVRGAGSNDRGGNGLGLFIARRVVEAHGGVIELRPGRPGAEFCIELPLVERGRSTSAS